MFRSKMLVSYRIGMPGQRGGPRTGDPAPPRTHFVGRRPEIVVALHRLATYRLVTLLGTGGMGKTRLAQQIRSRIRRSVTVRWVQLVDLDLTTDAAILIQTVADTCGVRDFSAGTAWDALVDTLSTHTHLLILDNADRIVEPLGALVSDLLAAVPTVQILVTSRQPLGCDGEQHLPIPPLTADEGWELLQDRAAGIGITLTERHHPLGRQLCHRLDGIPLAIELAAQRLRAMSIHDLLTAADDRLRLLTGGPRHGAHPTHTSLRAMVAWSWDLCTPAEQTLWARCSVFPAGAGWDLPAAAHICADPPDPPDHQVEQPAYLDQGAPATLNGQDVLAVLDGLVDKHIVVSDPSHSRTRYRMLDTLRLYGDEVLQHRGDVAPLRRRHSAYYSAGIRQAATGWFSPHDVDWLDWAALNLANLRATYDAALADPDTMIDAVEFAANLTRLRAWFVIGSPREGLAWLEQALTAVTTTHQALTPDQVEQVLAGYAMAGWITLWQGQPAQSSLTAGQRWSQPGPQSPHLTYLEGAHLLFARNDPGAIDLLATARQAFTAAGPAYRGDANRAELTEATAAAFLGTPDQALTITRRCLDNAQTAGASSAIAWARVVRAIALMTHGEPDHAVTLARLALSWSHSQDDRWGSIWAIHLVAWAQAEQLARHTAPPGTAATVAYLLGGADRIRLRAGLNLPGLLPFATATTHADTLARAAVDHDTFTNAYQRGLAAQPEEITATALGQPAESPRRSPSPRTPQAWDTLTSTEQQVARLAADGLSNPDIARRRNVSARTVETQMTSILRRLGIANRHQISTMIPTDIVNAAAKVEDSQ